MAVIKSLKLTPTEKRLQDLKEQLYGKNPVKNSYVKVIKELIKIIKSLSGSTDIYQAYQRSKSNLRSKKIVSVKEAESIYNYVNTVIEEQKEWIKING